MDKEIKEFEAWWGQDCDTALNPYSQHSTMYRAWEAWKAGRAASQREWVSLTDGERMELAVATGAMSADWLIFMEAVEAKLKEKNT